MQPETPEPQAPRKRGRPKKVSTPYPARLLRNLLSGSLGSTTARYAGVQQSEDERVLSLLVTDLDGKRYRLTVQPDKPEPKRAPQPKAAATRRKTRGKR